MPYYQKNQLSNTQNMENSYIIKIVQNKFDSSIAKIVNIVLKNTHILKINAEVGQCFALTSISALFV